MLWQIGTGFDQPVVMSLKVLIVVVSLTAHEYASIASHQFRRPLSGRVLRLLNQRCIRFFSACRIIASALAGSSPTPLIIFSASAGA